MNKGLENVFTYNRYGYYVGNREANWKQLWDRIT